MTEMREGNRSLDRPLTMFERALYHGEGFHVNVMTTVRISGEITEQQIRQALARIQEKHTVLRCLVVQKGGRPWFVQQEQPAPVPLRMIPRQTENDWLEVATLESLKRFDGSRGPLARVVWLRGETVSELLLICSHALCDGRSLMTLLREILLLCDQPDADIGDPTTLNSLDEVFPKEVLTDRHLQRRIRWKAAGAKLMLRLPRRATAWTYGKVYRCLWTLDEQASQLLVARCKAENTNVFAALGLSCMLAFRDACGPKHIERFEAPVDFRRYLPNLRSDSLFAIAPTITLSLQELRNTAPGPAGFWEMARALRGRMSRKVEKLKSTVFPLFLGIEHLHDVYDRMAVYAQSKRAGRKVSLSYLGRVDGEQNYQKFRLMEICDISAMMTPTPANLIAIYSFDGRFYFSLSSDESSLPYAKALEIKEQIISTLHACVADFAISGAMSVAVGAEAS